MSEPHPFMAHPQGSACGAVLPQTPGPYEGVCGKAESDPIHQQRGMAEPLQQRADTPGHDMSGCTWDEAEIRQVFEGAREIPVYPGPDMTKPAHTADSLMYQLRLLRTGKDDADTIRLAHKKINDLNARIRLWDQIGREAEDGAALLKAIRDQLSAGEGGSDG